MSEIDAILFANEAFYRAFADRDADAMAELWAKDAAVTCLHPGWGLLSGRADVLESWRRILGNDAAPSIACRRPKAYVHGDVAFVVCYEEIEGQILIATNAFRREGRHWRLIHHQAGPTAVAPPPDDPIEEPPKPN
jgi:ketosteroid isomerase-like protein